MCRTGVGPKSLSFVASAVGNLEMVTSGCLEPESASTRFEVCLVQDQARRFRFVDFAKKNTVRSPSDGISGELR